MSQITIPKTEYDKLKKHSRAYKNKLSSFFEAVVSSPVEEVVADFKKTGIYSDGFINDLEIGLKKILLWKIIMHLKPLRLDLLRYIEKHNLFRKWIKVSMLFAENHRHPSLHFELLKPKWRGIYSFRIDKKFRTLCFIDKNGLIEVFQITNHYKK